MQATELLAEEATEFYMVGRKVGGFGIRAFFICVQDCVPDAQASAVRRPVILAIT